MKVGELRSLLKDASQADLENALVEIYKLLPKASKESKADPMIKGILAGEKTSELKAAIKKDSEPVLTSKVIIDEAYGFIEDAENFNYYYINKKISKKQQAGWRHQMKRYINFSRNIKEEDSEYDDGRYLLKDLYDLMCRSRWYKTFHSEEPFESIGISQCDLFRMAIENMYSVSRDKANLFELAESCCTGGLSAETTYSSLIRIFLSSLENDKERTEVKEWVRQYAEKEIDAFKKASSNLREDIEDWKLTHGQNSSNAAEMFLLLCASENKAQEGIEFYWKIGSICDWNTEVTLYKLLELIGSLDIKDSRSWWIQIYERAVKDGIEPRESLQKLYAEKKSSLPI